MKKNNDRNLQQRMETPYDPNHDVDDDSVDNAVMSNSGLNSGFFGSSMDQSSPK